jgi:hypothetical protein
MAKSNFQVSTTGLVALVAATAKTVLSVFAPTNQRVAVSGIHVSFDGVAGTGVPVQVEIARTTTAGTNTAVNPRGNDPDVIAGTAIQSTAGENYTVEPTYGDILKEINVHPQSGYEVHIPFGREIIVDGGGRLSIRCTAAAGVNVAADMDCEE